MIKKNINYGITIALIILAVLFTGCIQTQQIQRDSLTRSNPGGLTYHCSDPTDYGNGILFFNCYGMDLAPSLSNYTRIHNLTVESIAEISDSYSYNGNVGFIVVVK